MSSFDFIKHGNYLQLRVKNAVLDCLIIVAPPSPPQQVRAFLEPPIEGVVLETYGSGNVPDSREELLEEIRAAAKRGVIIANCTQCLYGHVVDSYATGRVRKFLRFNWVL